MSIPPTTMPFVQFGAHRLDDGRLPVYFHKPGQPGGYVPAQVWQLELRDYPKLSRLLKWWEEKGGTEVFVSEDLGNRALSLPWVGPMLLGVKKAKDGLLNRVLKNRFDDGDDQFKAMHDATAIHDYAMTVDGRTLAMLRMTRQDAGSLSYYRQHYDGLSFGADKPVYEIELLQSAFWNRGHADQRLLKGNFDDVTRTLMGRAVDELPDDADIIYTPASKPVDWLFKSLLTSLNVPYDQYYSRALQGRQDLSPADFEDDYPDFYRMKASELKPAMAAWAQGQAQQSFDAEAMADARQALSSIDEPVRLVRKAGFEPDLTGGPS